MNENFKMGSVALIGKPNVGKSTLMNYILEAKIAITSKRPQTTRFKIMGIKTTDESQIIFLDTPGIHRPDSVLGDTIVDHSVSSIREADIILFLIDGHKGWNKEDTDLYDRYLKKRIDIPIILVINKVDIVDKTKLFNKMMEIQTKGYHFDEYIPVSAFSGDNVDALLRLINDKLPIGEQMYDEEEVTNIPLKTMISETLREKILRNSYNEIPHSVAVYVESFRDGDKSDRAKVLDIIVYVERDSQKGIIVGKKGEFLKKISRETRDEIQELYGISLFLNIQVKAKKDWKDKKEFIDLLGYKF